MSNSTTSCCTVAPADSSDVTVKDPVCEMTVAPAKTEHHTTHDGHDYHFCSSGCLGKFIADPAKYLTDSPHAEPIAIAGAIWTCPMHPEIRRDGPGPCPICGMALEPEAPSLDDGPSAELIDFTRRWWVSALLAVPLLILTMGTDLFGLRLIDPMISPWTQPALQLGRWRGPS